MGIEEILYGICLQCDKASHLGKELFLPGLLYGMLYELDMQDPQKSNWWTLQKTDWFLRAPASQKKWANILQYIEESDGQTANIVQTVFQISCFMEKSAKYYGPVG